MNNVKSYILVLVFVTGWSIITAQKKELPKSNFILADIIKTTVMIIDTTNPSIIGKEYNHLHEYKVDNSMLYMEPIKFNQLINQFKKTVYNKNAIISIWCLPNETNRKKITDFFRSCDAVEVEDFDSKGNSFLRYVIHCDSTSIFEKITTIEFYEKWNFNTINGMIEKEVIAYTPLRQTEKGFLMPLYTVYRNKNALKLITDSSQ